MKLEWPENRVSFLLDYVQQRGVKASSKQREFGKQLFWFAYQRDWPSVLKIISETTSSFEVGPWSCVNRRCIIHELAESFPSLGRLGCAKMCVLASPGWLALWEGFCSLWKAADIIRLIFHCDLGALTGSPYEFHLLRLHLADSSQWGSKFEAHKSNAKGKTAYEQVYLCTDHVGSNTSHACTSCISFAESKNNSNFR